MVGAGLPRPYFFYGAFGEVLGKIPAFGYFPPVLFSGTTPFSCIFFR